MKENRSYITLISDDKYVAGVIALNKMLSKVNSKYPLICAYSNDVSNKCLDIISSNNIKLIRISNSIDIGNITQSNYSHWLKTFDKLNIWDFVEYDKLVFLDADLLLLSNIDNLFNKQPFSGVCAGKNTPGCENYHGINSGLMVIKPDHEIASKLRSKAKEIVTKFSTIGKPVGDQDVIQAYLGEEWDYDTSLHLDDSYNMFAIDLEYYMNKCGYHFPNKNYYSEKQINVIHFIGALKPWMWKDLSIKNKLRLIKMIVLRSAYRKAFIKYQDFI